MTESIEQAALKAARIRAIHEFGPAVGEFTAQHTDIAATFKRVRERQQEAAQQPNVTSIKKRGAS